MAARRFQGPEIKLCCLGHQQLTLCGGSHGRHAVRPVGWQGNLDDLHEQAEPPKTALLPLRRWRCRGRIGENVAMSESRASLQFDLDLEAVRLLHRSVSFHLEKWPGGPDPREQEALQAMKTLLTAALLEFSLDQDAQR